MADEKEEVVIRPSHKRLPHNDVRGIPYNRRTGNMDIGKIVKNASDKQNDDATDEDENALSLKRKK